MPSAEPGASLEQLREAIRTRVEATSLRQTSREIGISHPSLRDLLNGTVPRGTTMARLREWHARETNETLRLRQENAALRQRIAELERELRSRG
jgi:hypothetical protein